MKRAAQASLFGLLLSTTLLAVPSPAFADDKAACLDAASRGQKLRASHKLVESRAQLRVCAAAGCPSAVQADCVGWLAEVEKALPGVVITAKNGAGLDLIDVKVSVDGALLVSKLDGQAVTMDAGAHVFHFEAPDGTTLDRQVLVTEGAKSQLVAVVLAGAPAPDATPAVGVTPESSPFRTVGWVAGGVGVAGIVVGAIFGGVAVSDKSSAHCVNNVCDAGTVSAIKSAALVSDIGIIAGAAVLAGGAALVLFAPHGQAAHATTGVRIVPVVTTGSGQLMAVGRF